MMVSINYTRTYMGRDNSRMMSRIAASCVDKPKRGHPKVDRTKPQPISPSRNSIALCHDIQCFEQGGLRQLVRACVEVDATAFPSPWCSMRKAASLKP
jgi:hypothetical protein